MPTITIALQLNASHTRSLSNKLRANGVGPESKVLPLARRHQISGQRTAALAASDHERTVAVRVVLLVGVVIRDDLLPPGLFEATTQHLEALLLVELPISRRDRSLYLPGG